MSLRQMLLAAAVMAPLALALGCAPKTQVDAGAQINAPAAAEPDRVASYDNLPNETLTPEPPLGAPGNPVGGSYTPPPVVEPAPAAPVGRTHVVQKGDTYFSLAAKYYGRGSKANVQKLMDANPQYPASKLPIGATIQVP